MSGRLVGEVVDWLQTPPAEGLTMAERMVLLVIAERAHEKTREMWRHRIDDRSLYERIRAAAGLSDRGLSAALKRLRERGLEVCVPIGTDRRGRPLYAARGRSMRFRLPPLPAAVTLPEPVENTPADPVDNPAQTGPPGEKGRTLVRPNARKVAPSCDQTARKVAPGCAPNPSSTYPSKEHPSTGLRSLGAELEVATTAARDPTNDLDQVGDYEQATRALQRLPDLGAALITQARTQHPDADLRQLVIHAAHLAAKGVPA